jgi:hypothetical protein
MDQPTIFHRISHKDDQLLCATNVIAEPKFMIDTYQYLAAVGT